MLARSSSPHPVVPGRSTATKPQKLDIVEKRQLDDAERPALRRMFVDTFGEVPWRKYASKDLEDAFDAELAPNVQRHWLVARERGAPAALASYAIDAHNRPTYVGQMCVRTALQGQGLGRALLDDLKSRVAPGASLTLVTRRANGPAVAMYERAGFVEDASAMHGYGADYVGYRWTKPMRTDGSGAIAKPAHGLT